MRQDEKKPTRCEDGGGGGGGRGGGGKASASSSAAAGEERRRVRGKRKKKAAVVKSAVFQREGDDASKRNEKKPRTALEATPSPRQQQQRRQRQQQQQQQQQQPQQRHRRPAFDPADDCETPLEAYRHVAPLLAKLAQRLKIPKHQLRIWDPYYCDGAVRTHLASLGFPNVHNASGEDFYALMASSGDGEGHVEGGEEEEGDDEKIAKKIPPHDVLVTNPPFSGDHASRLVRYLSSSRRGANTPFFILAPEYVHRKAWYAPLERRRSDIFYMVPLERYAFTAARGGRAQNTDVPCRHWAREGRCPRGDACPFVHDAVDDEKTAARADDDEGEGEGEEEEEEEEEEDSDGAGALISSSSKATAKSGGGSGGGGPVIVAPFDCVWHVHLGGGNAAETRRRTQSVVQAWRQKYERGGGGGGGAGGAGGGGVGDGGDGDDVDDDLGDGGGEEEEQEEKKQKGRKNKWKAKKSKNKNGVGVGVRLVASAEGLPPPPAKKKHTPQQRR